MFGKEPKLYFKGDDKKTSFLGTIMSIIFMVLYIGFLLYRIIKMLNRASFTFYETSSYLEEPPSIKIDKDNFYGGFALEHPITYDPIIDETIYYPKAYFKKQKRNGNNWDFEIKELELERCQLEKFGKKYQNKIVHNSLNNLYCPKVLEETLMGHFSYDVYSYLYVEFFPCKNTSENNNHCKSEEEIDFYLRNTFVCFEMEDIELTPKNFIDPVMARNQDIYFTVGKKLFQEIHVFYQIIKIETDLDLLGFEDIENIKTQEYLKYHSTIQMTNLLENNIYKTGEAFSAVTIKLFDFVKTQRRTYYKIIDILGEVGGLMEVIFSIFQMISSFITSILYELSIVNNLFEFDINNNKAKVKNNIKTIQNKNEDSKIMIPSIMNIMKKNDNILEPHTNNEINKNTIGNQYRMLKRQKNNRRGLRLRILVESNTDD